MFDNKVTPQRFFPECVYQGQNKTVTTCSDPNNENFNGACNKRCKTPTSKFNLPDWRKNKKKPAKGLQR